MKKFKSICLVLLSLTLIACQTGGGDYVYANVNDNVVNSALELKVGDPGDSGDSTLFGLLHQLLDTIGIAKFASVPTADEYPQATLVEKVNYIEKELRSVFQSASDGKLLLQTSLANEGISISKDTPQTFETINDSLNLLCTNYKTKLGELDEALLKANSNKTLIVSVSGWEGYCDGQPHGINVLADAELYDITYGTSADACTLTESPTYTDQGKYTVWYSIAGKQNEKALVGSEVVNIKGYDLSTATVLWSNGVVTVACGDKVLVAGTHYNVTYTMSQSGSYYYKCASITAAPNQTLVKGSTSSCDTANPLVYVGATCATHYGYFHVPVYETEVDLNTVMSFDWSVQITGTGYYRVGQAATITIKFTQGIPDWCHKYALIVNGTCLNSFDHVGIHNFYCPNNCTQPHGRPASVSATIASKTISVTGPTTIQSTLEINQGNMGSNAGGQFGEWLTFNWVN